MTGPIPPFRRRRSSQEGFTFVEVILIVTILGILAGVILPEFLDKLHKTKIVSFGRTLTTVVVKARLEAIQKGRRVCVDFEANQVAARLDCDDVNAEEIGKALIPSGFGYAAPGGENLVQGLEVLPPPRHARLVFNADGSADAVGAVRFGDTRPMPNYFDLWVGPARAVPRGKMRIWNRTDLAWYAKGEGPGYGGWAWK